MHQVSLFLAETSAYEQLLNTVEDMEVQTTLDVSFVVHFPSLLTRIESVAHSSSAIGNRPMQPRSLVPGRSRLTMGTREKR